MLKDFYEIYFEDVWLENKYKFNGDNTSINKVIYRIRETLSNYNTAIYDFEFYRHKISLEKSEFENQLDGLFGLYN